jgi:DNA-binding NarL/FixJ family response regulator
MSQKLDLQEILVLETDVEQGAVVARLISRLFPAARVYCESTPTRAAAVLSEGTIDLFVVAVRGFDIDVLTLLGAWADHGSSCTRVVVMSPDLRSNAVAALRCLPIQGWVNATAAIEELEVACRSVAKGGTYSSLATAGSRRMAEGPLPASDSEDFLWRVAPPRAVRVTRRLRRPRD